MPTSDASWSGSLRRIGELERPAHYHLDSGDECYFLGDYTARKGYGFSVTNQHIANLKKHPRHRGTAQWRHKQSAIELIGRTISENLNPETLQIITFVPIPPSKTPSHPEYDDRMAQVARAIGPDADVRELIVSAMDREPRHGADRRRDPVALRESLQLRAEPLSPPSGMIVLIDDVLTTGCSFKVCKSMLTGRWPALAVIGVFVARRVFPSAADEFDAVDP